MNSIFKICNTGNCNISITGLEQDSDQYLNEPQVSNKNYTWEDTVTLDVIYKVGSDEEETLESYEVVPHTDIDSLEIELKKDGLYKILHIIVPTQSWFQYVCERDVQHLDSYELLYFFNTTDECFYKYNLGNIQKIELEEMLEVNLSITNLVVGDKYTFNLCYLKECFFKLCKYLLDNLPCECTTAKDFKQDILNRDIIWMALNVINYLIQQGNYFKAQSILERIDTCWGICSKLNNRSIDGSTGCGCNG